MIADMPRNAPQKCDFIGVSEDIVWDKIMTDNPRGALIISQKPGAIGSSDGSATVGKAFLPTDIIKREESRGRFGRRRSLPNGCRNLLGFRNRLSSSAVQETWSGD